MRRVAPAVITMFAYALALVLMGALTYLARPEGVGWAKAATAVLVPSIAAAMMIVCAVLSMQVKSSYRNAMIGIHLGLVLPLLVAVGAGMRVPSSLEKNRAYYAAQSLEAEGAPQAEAVEDVAPEFPLGYQAVGIGGVAALSVFAFIALLAQRPRLEKPGREEDETPDERPADPPRPMSAPVSAAPAPSPAPEEPEEPETAPLPADPDQDKPDDRV